MSIINPQPAPGTLNTSTSFVVSSSGGQQTATPVQVSALLGITAATVAGTTTTQPPASSATPTTIPTSTPTTTPASAPVATVAAGNPMPGLVMAIDAALPATQAALVAGTPGIQVDSNNNVLNLIEPVNGYPCGHGYGETMLASGGPGGFPIFRSTAAGYNQTYDAVVMPFQVGTTLFDAANAGAYVVFVLKQTAAGGNALLQAWGANANCNILCTATDGAVRVEQNNGGAVGTEPSNAATALGQWQILEVIFDPTKKTIAIWRNGALTFETPPGYIGNIGALSRFELMNDARADVSCVLLGSTIPTVSQQNAVRAFLGTRYGVSSTTSTPVVVNTPSVGQNGALLDYPQLYRQPSGPIFKNNAAQPFGITLVNPASNVQWLKFGSGLSDANVKSQADLFSQVYTRNANNITSPSYYPNQGENGFDAVYRDYPEADPRNLHVIKSDHMELILRTLVAGETSSYRYEMGFMRLLEHVKPGRVAEICWTWPGGDHDPVTGQLMSWPTFWGFSTYQEPLTGNVYAAQPSLELDFPDNFKEDNSSLGDSYNTGYVLYGTYLQDANGAYYPDPSVYGNPNDTYLSNTPPFVVGRTGRTYVTDPAKKPITGKHYFTIDWRDGNTLLFIIDGVVVRRLHLVYPSVFGSGGSYVVNGNAPPASLNGTPVPLNIEIGHQSQARFNPNTYARMLANNDTTNPLTASLNIYSIGVWDSTSTAQPPTSTPVPALPAPQTGAALGDLPALSSVSYLLNIDTSKSNPMADQLGLNQTYPVNNIFAPTDQVNGLATLHLDSDNDNPASIGVRGPVVGWAQGAGQFVLFVTYRQINAYEASHPQFLAQFTRDTPQADQDTNRISLAMSSFSGGGSIKGFTTHGTNYGAYISTSTGHIVSAATGGCNQGQAEVISMEKTLAGDGTVVISQGYSQQRNLPASGGGVPPADIGGLTELIIGAAREYGGFATRGTLGLLCQVVVVGIPNGRALSDADRATIINYMQGQRAATATSLSTSGNQPAVALAKAPILSTAPVAVSISGLNFAWANQGSASVTGGGTSPIVLSSPGQNADSVQALLTPMAQGTYTMLITPGFAPGSYPNAGIWWGKQGQSYGGALLELVTSSGGAMITSTRPDYVSGDNSFGSANVTFGQQNTPYLMRLVIDSKNVTAAVAPVGAAAGGFTQIGQATWTNLGSPDCIGFYVNFDNGVAGNITVGGFVHTNSTDIQAAPPSFNQGGTSQQATTPLGAAMPPNLANAPVAATLSGLNFSWANQGPATVSGGGTSPMVLSSPGQNSDNVQALLTALVPGTYTALVTGGYASGNYPNAGIMVGKTGSTALTHLLCLQPSSAGSQMIASSRPTFLSGDSGFGSKNVAFGQQNTPYLMRIVVDGTNYTAAVAPVGAAAGGFTQIGQATLASIGSPDQIGPYVNFNNGVAGSMTFGGFVHTSATDIQAAPPSFP